MSGIVQFVGKFDMNSLEQWSRDGYDAVRKYDKIYSKWLDIPESVRVTTIKPSGTVSLLAGATPGVHFPISRYYIRRVRVAASHPLVGQMKAKGFHVEPDVRDPEGTMVVSFPIDVGSDEIVTMENVTMFDQLEIAAFMQKHWSDNAVSVTVTFKSHEADFIEQALNHYQHSLKAVSFLPEGDAVYPQMPYEKITEDKYKEMVSAINDETLVGRGDGAGEKFCDGDSCTI